MDGFTMPIGPCVENIGFYNINSLCLALLLTWNNSKLDLSRHCRISGNKQTIALVFVKKKSIQIYFLK